MPVVLIRGSGFIESRLARRLKRRANVELPIFDKAASHASPEVGVLGEVRPIDDLLNAVT